MKCHFSKRSPNSIGWTRPKAAVQHPYPLTRSVTVRGEGLTYVGKKLPGAGEEVVTLPESGKGIDTGVIFCTHRGHGRGMEKSDFLNLLVVEPILDILVSGYVESEEFLVFHPLFERLYFLFDRVKIEVYVGNESRIVFRTVEKIEQWIDIDEDDRFSVMSIYSLVFKTEQSVHVVSAVCNDLPLSGLKIRYVDGEFERCVTFDPRNFFGFSFGS
ncbi:MAG: hypothetical protein LBE22_12630 [Azoarcus sp.]|jgi:hypothetical protein|nr:hypothetical protein [Azoarcus sp.]